MMDHYEVLGLRWMDKPDWAAIKKAYHKLALASHPDRFPPEDRLRQTKIMAGLNAARDILNDPVTKEAFDQTCETAAEKEKGGQEEKMEEKTRRAKEVVREKERVRLKKEADAAAAAAAAADDSGLLPIRGRMIRYVGACCSVILAANLASARKLKKQRIMRLERMKVKFAKETKEALVAISFIALALTVQIIQ
jgi:curved DNA-binding protein CbpA